MEQPPYQLVYLMFGAELVEIPEMEPSILMVVAKHSISSPIVM